MAVVRQVAMWGNEILYYVLMVIRLGNSGANGYVERHGEVVLRIV